MRLRPGGALPARLVTTGAGRPTDGDGESDAAGTGRGDEAPGGEPALWDGDRPGNRSRTGPAAPEPEPETVLAWPPLHGMTEPPGPPIRPAAMTIRQATSATHAPTPNWRIRRMRRPERSVNTGPPPGAGDFHSNGGRRPGPRWARTLPGRDPVTVADPFGHPGHRTGNSRRSAAG